MNKETKQGLAFVFFGIMFLGGMMPLPLGPVLAIIGFVPGILLISSDSGNEERQHEIYVPAPQPAIPVEREEAELEEWP